MLNLSPNLNTINLRNALPGTILRLPRTPGNLVALVTDQVADDVPSLILLNPPDGLISLRRMHIDGPCLKFQSELRLNLDIKLGVYDVSGRMLETSGIACVIDNDVYLRIAVSSNYSDEFAFVNFRTGAVSQPQIYRFWAFPSWSITVEDAQNKRQTVFEHSLKVTP